MNVMDIGFMATIGIAVAFIGVLLRNQGRKKDEALKKLKAECLEPQEAPKKQVIAQPKTKIEPSISTNPQNYCRPPGVPAPAEPEPKTTFVGGYKYAPDEEWPFEKKPLITNTESILFERLLQALPNNHIFTQVQLSQLVRVKKGHSFKVWFSRISQMSADFVIADSSFNIVAVIELDDKSHYSNEDRQKADQKKDKALTAAGIKVVRWRCEVMPSVEQIQLTFPECKA